MFSIDYDYINKEAEQAYQSNADKDPANYDGLKNACIDLRAMSVIKKSGLEPFPELIKLAPGAVLKIGSGIKLRAWYIDEMHKAGRVEAHFEVHARSGLGSDLLVLANNTGIIDHIWSNEIIVVLHNNSRRYFEIANGDRIAQAKPFCVWSKTQRNAIEDYERGGFGSSGAE